jgi:hypothetical protein
MQKYLRTDKHLYFILLVKWLDERDCIGFHSPIRLHGEVLN